MIDCFFEYICILLSLFWGVLAFLNLPKTFFFSVLCASSLLSICLRSYRLYTNICQRHINHPLFFCDVFFAILSFFIFLVKSKKMKRGVISTLIIMLIARMYHPLQLSWVLQTFGHLLLVIINANVFMYGHI